MNNLLNYILEYKGVALHNNRKSIGDPDGISHDYQEGVVELDYTEGGQPFAFIYNKKKNKVLFSDEGCTHRDIFDNYKDTDEGDEVGLNILNSTHQLRYTGSFFAWGDKNPKKEMTEWYNENKNVLKVLCEGRIWYLEHIKWELQQYNDDWVEDNEDKIKEFPKLNKNVKAYIAFWNDIPAGKFKEYCDNIIKLFNAEHDSKIVEYIAVGNNGEALFMNINDNTTVKTKQRTAARKKEIEKVYDLHNPKYGETLDEFRKRKKEALKGYNKARGEHFQRDYYNQTKSKTAAEWHNNKTKRYNPHTGKMEWGEKIGDSLQMKNLKDYICEASSQIKQATANLKMKFDVDPLDNYVYLQDEIDLDDTDNEKDIWIKDEIEQIIIDLHNVDKDIWDFTHNKDWNTFMKCFKREYKNEPYYELALQFFDKIENTNK